MYIKMMKEKRAAHRGVTIGTFQQRRGEGSNSHHAGANCQSSCGQPDSGGFCPPSQPRRIGTTPSAPGAAGWARARPSARGGSRPPARPGPRWERLETSRARSPRTPTFCSSAEAASGTSADILLPLQTRHRERMRLPGGRGRPAASSPLVPALRAPARAASARENGRRLMTTRNPAAFCDSGPPAARSPLPRRAPAYLTPLLRLCDAEALPFFLQRSRLAPHLTSACPILSGTCSF